MRIAIGVAYLGQGYHGFQRQEGSLPTLQATIESALSRVANSPITTVAAGRTDSGVHALGQVIHFDTSVLRPEANWLAGTQRYLPEAITLHWVRQVPDAFHARRSACCREYIYRLNTGPKQLLLTGRALHVRSALCVERMQIAASMLLGTHDFKHFAAENACKNTVRTLRRAEIKKIDDHLFFIFEADGFLYHMVRNIVGSLLQIGTLQQPPLWMALRLRGEAHGGAMAPAHGLYLTQVTYPLVFALPAPVEEIMRFF